MAQNNDNSGLVGFAFLIAFAWFAMVFVFAVAAFFAFVLTVMSIMAWHKPLKFGSNTITTEEAHTFVKRGLAGAVLIPAFAVFCAVLFGWIVKDEYWFYLIVGGYTAGSVGLGLFEAQQEEEEKAKAAAVAQFYIPPQPSEPPRRAVRTMAQVQDQPPFRFATWDDEEKRS